MVLKKGFNDDDTTKLRLVIDYKHNENTVLIDIQCKILRWLCQTLNKLNTFPSSTYDLYSTIIFMKETDIEKTSLLINNGIYELVSDQF